MSDEDILRRLLKEEASTVNPNGSFDDVEDRLRSRRALPILAAVAAVAAVVLGVVLLTSDDDQDVNIVPADTTTTAEPATTTTVAEPVDEIGQGVWPFTTGTEADSNTDDTYLDPVETARAFLETYVGMTEFELGEFAQGDSRSGEVVATTQPTGDETVVLLRQIGTSDAWTVIGAATDDIRIEVPDVLDEITSPLRIEGESCCAFEGNVVVQVRQDGQEGPDSFLGQEPVIGGSMEEFGPFEADIAFDTPTEPGGAIVAFTTSARDGSIERVAVIRIFFAATDG
jgi:hypothetical protein